MDEGINSMVETIQELEKENQQLKELLEDAEPKKGMNSTLSMAWIKKKRELLK